MIPTNEGDKPKRRKWSLTKSITEISELEGVNPKKIREDLIVSGMAVEVWGQTYSDPDEVERLKNRRVREERGKINRDNKQSSVPIDMVTKEDSGILDGLIARAEMKLPAIREKISDLEETLKNPELEAYDRGRKERDLIVLIKREKNNVEIKEQCEKRRNEIWTTENSKSDEQPDPSKEDPTEGESPEA